MIGTRLGHGADTSRQGACLSRLLFCDQFVDSESSPYYLQARYYDAVTGQFLTRDPMTATTGEPYEFGADDPVNHCDPSGGIATYTAGTQGGGAPTHKSTSTTSGDSGGAVPAPASPSPHPMRIIAKQASDGCSGICFGQWLAAAVEAVTSTESGSHTAGACASVDGYAFLGFSGEHAALFTGMDEIRLASGPPKRLE